MTQFPTPARPNSADRKFTVTQMVAFTACSNI